MAQGVAFESEEAKSKLQILEERLRAIEGGGHHGFGDVTDLCLVPDVIIPPKFKVPEFEKYKGTSCPKNHLTMYCRKMAAYAYDEKLLVHFFQDSLAGTTLNWYMHLELARIRSWRDLVDAFLKQYKYNVDMAPDRLQLQNMSKKGSETFKEYAQRWSDLAAQVEPPLHDREMMAMFINTLQSPFYEHMLGSVSSSFADIIVIGGIIEFGLKSGKIAQGPLAVANSRKPGFNSAKRKGEVQAASATPYSENHPSARYRPNYLQPHTHPPYITTNVSASQPSFPRPRPPYQAQPVPGNAYQPKQGWENEIGFIPNQGPSQNYALKEGQDRSFPQFTPIPVSYMDLLPTLLRKALVTVCPMRPLQPPYPKNYNANAKCDYHGGAVGYSIEDCKAFKFKVQSLIDSGWLTFQEDKPSIENNPLSRHASTSTNAIMDEKGFGLVRKVDKIKSSMEYVFMTLCQTGLLKAKRQQGGTCSFHPDAQHSINECYGFKELLQDLIDRHILQVCYKERKEKYVH